MENSIDREEREQYHESSNTPRIGQKRKVQQIKQLVNSLKEVSDSLNKPTVDNEFEVFGRNVGLQLQNMPLDMALEAQEHINSYLTRLRLRNLRNRHHESFSTYPASDISTPTPIASPTTDSTFFALSECSNNTHSSQEGTNILSQAMIGAFYNNE